jgi:hypothetical protein
MTTSEDLFAARKTRSKNVELTGMLKLAFLHCGAAQKIVLDSTIAIDVK